MSVAAIAPMLAAVSLSVTTDPSLPAPNLLPENISNFTTNVVFSKEKKSVYRNIRKDIVVPGRTYILSCEIKPSVDVSARFPLSGLGCELTYWSSDWKKGVTLMARGDGDGAWRRVVSKKVTIPDWVHHGQLHAGLAYTGGCGEVRNIGLYQPDCEIVIEAKSGCGIAQVKVVDGDLATVFDSGVLNGAQAVWRGRVMADPARNYAVYAIDTKGNVAVWRTEKIDLAAGNGKRKVNKKRSFGHADK